ncbi:MAG: hypothetical protein JSU86_16845 [Phycisphaerales bacterium]|nr:MAG: hypothetical protein JSU86_16845 [Phycisphaerales bacterium]
MTFEISGCVREAETGCGVPGVIVSAFDRDRVYDDLLGEVMSDATGAFRLEYEEGAFRDLFEKTPDLYLTVKTPSGRVLYTTKETTRFNATAREKFNLEIPQAVLRAAGIRAAEPLHDISRVVLTTLTCLESAESDDDLVKQIKADLVGKSSILAVMKDYMADLKGELDNNALPYRKLQRLFELGATPEGMEGHHYGVTLGLRMGDLRGWAADCGNLLGYLWGTVIAGQCPWVGKSFTPMTQGDRSQVTGTAVAADVPMYRGINHFNVIEHAPINVSANALLTFLWSLNEVPEAERLRYGNERNGGHFVSHRAPSVCRHNPREVFSPSYRYTGLWDVPPLCWNTPREVFSLSYRYTGLGNVPPLTYLIDEVVEIADGLFLGQLLFATARLLERYDPRANDEVYDYQHFGYFLLFREEWNGEARRLFPHLEMPAAAVTTRIVPPRGREEEPAAGPPDKFTALTLDDPLEDHVDLTALNAVRKDLAEAGTVIRMLRSYSDMLHHDPDTRSPVFDKLLTLFNAGIGPPTVEGFYRGALVAWQSQGLLAVFDVNTIDVGWQTARCFSPWTGKRFDPVDRQRLLELTDNHETMDVPTFFCANTVVFRTARERFTRKLMELAGVWMEDATREERRRYGYDAKTFFFIGKQAPSVLSENKGRTVFQFNYRWKQLRNIPPDNFCIDELVQIASGLYLGQLLYATDLLRPWSPETEASKYQYRLFGYFLLMDEEWHAQRLRIGFDLDNT